MLVSRFPGIPDPSRGLRVQLSRAQGSDPEILYSPESVLARGWLLSKQIEAGAAMRTDFKIGYTFSCLFDLLFICLVFSHAGHS